VLFPPNGSRADTGTGGFHQEVSPMLFSHELVAKRPDFGTCRVRSQKKLIRPEGCIRISFGSQDFDWRALAMLPAYELSGFKPADDCSFQTNDVNGVLAVIACKKQILYLCFCLRSPLPAANIIYKKFAPGVPIYFKTLGIDLIVLKRHEAAEFMQ
jgi:hypothetical protein